MAELRNLEDLKAFYSSAQCRAPKDLVVAHYYFPHYHFSALNVELYGGRWTEHVLRQAARSWFPGHSQPRAPLWG